MIQPYWELKLQEAASGRPCEQRAARASRGSIQEVDGLAKIAQGLRLIDAVLVSLDPNTQHAAKGPRGCEI